MGTITTNVGLVTGIDYQDLVNKLIAIQARPRDLQTQRNKTFDQQRTAITSLTATLIALQVNTKKLASSSIYSQRTVASSDEAALSASANGQPQLGNYQLTPVRLAQAQQLQGSRLASDTAPLGAGALTLRHGGFVDRGVSLDLLNAGEGFVRGKILLTDRSGVTAEIDLRFARDIDDALAAINDNATLGIRAEAIGDRLRLIDTTGQTTSNLRVQEVGDGTTAASLGLGGINVAASAALGDDVLTLFDELPLALVNDGAGVRISNVLSDLQISFRDGTTSTVDFHRLAIAGTKTRGTTDAAAGVNAKVTFTAVEPGSAYDGVVVSFVDDAGVAAGNETVEYDDDLKTLTFHIDAGATTADHIIAALAADPVVSTLFTAARATGGDGSGLIDTADTAVLAGPQATAISLGTLSDEAKILFTAVQGGAAFNDVDIEFVDNAGIDAGEETVAYDDSNPADKKLVFQIDAGNSTAAQIIAALNNDPTANQYFTAENAAGSNGAGLIDAADAVTTAGGQVVEPVSSTNELTLADVIDALATATGGKLQAEIGADGRGLVLTDLTADNGGTLAIAALNGSKAALDLGLDTTAVGDTITGRRLLGGLKSVLLNSLNGGTGFGTLGAIDLTDRSGATATVNLSAAETLDDVLGAINAAGIGLEAQINDARNGIVIVDTTGQTTSNLIVTNGDATNTADKLGLTIDAAVTNQSSGSLKLRVVGENTLLASLNGGVGVGTGALRVTDTTGTTRTLTISSSVKTVGELLTEIDRLGLAIEARVNDAGDGIVLIDTAEGESQLTVTSVSGNFTRDLHLLGGAKTVDIAGTPTSVIEGSTTLSIELDDDDSLTDLVQKINDAHFGVQAAAINDASSVKPFRLALFNGRSGKAGELLLDTSGVNFTFDETVKAQDALVALGSVDSPSSILATSGANTFSNLLPGLSLTVKKPSETPVTLTVGSTNTDLTASLQGFVDAYNRLRDQVSLLTKFDTETNTAAILQGDGSLLRVNAEITELATRRIFGAGSIQSLASLGISPDQEGRLTFDQSKFQALYDQDPAGVEEFLTAENTGLAARFDTLIESLAGANSSLLVSRAEALTRKLVAGGSRVEFLNARLEAARQRLLKQFQTSESLIAKIQANLSAISSIQPFIFFNTKNS